MDSEVRSLERLLASDPFDIAAREKLTFLYGKYGQFVSFRNRRAYRQRRHQMREKLMRWRAQSKIETPMWTHWDNVRSIHWYDYLNLSDQARYRILVRLYGSFEKVLEAYGL